MTVTRVVAPLEGAPESAESADAWFVRYGLPTPATLSTSPDANPTTRSPPPLNLPRRTLGESTPSEDLGTPQTNGTGTRTAGTEAAAEDAEDED